MHSSITLGAWSVMNIIYHFSNTTSIFLYVCAITHWPRCWRCRASMLGAVPTRMRGLGRAAGLGFGHLRHLLARSLPGIFGSLDQVLVALPASEKAAGERHRADVPAHRVLARRGPMPQVMEEVVSTTPNPFSILPVKAYSMPLNLNLSSTVL